MFSTAPCASIEALYTEINKLPAPQRQKRLEDGARKEGAFKFYGISAASLLSAYTAGFMKKYPFIKAEFWRGSGNKLVFRTLTEHRTGQLDTDAVLVGTENVMTLKRSGIWARYHSPESSNFGKEYTDKDGYWHADSLGISTIAYNTKLVRKDEAPKGYDDLFDPKWKGSSFHRYGARARVDGLVDRLGGTKDPSFRRGIDQKWGYRAPRPYFTSATFVCRRIQSWRGDLSRRNVADETRTVARRRSFFPTRRRRISAAPSASTPIRRTPTPLRCSSTS